MSADPYLVVRTASVYLTVVLIGAAVLWRRPTQRTIAGAVLATFWNLPALLLLHVAALRSGWWSFDARGGLLLGMPVDLYLAWACLWGAIPALAFPNAPLVRVVGVALAADLVLMPLAAPVVRLGSSWLVGEAFGLLLALGPGALLGRWTSQNRCLAGRAALQVVTFSGLVLLVVPAIVMDATGSTIANPLTWPAADISIAAQLLAIPAIVGLTAVQEFAARGHGTPVPFDPPTRLVTSGIYTYIRNPMQLSAIVFVMLLGLLLRNPWLAVAGIVAHVYAIGFAGWDEDEDLRRRFGGAWTQYRDNVPRWRPRLRPWHPPETTPSTLFVAESCDVCRGVARWFGERGARHLVIAPAESHPSGRLRRVTYEAGDGSESTAGVAAIARALEHIHLGWALVGFLLRLPAVGEFAQLLADASGGQPRRSHGATAARTPRRRRPRARRRSARAPAAPAAIAWRGRRSPSLTAPRCIACRRR